MIDSIRNKLVDLAGKDEDGKLISLDDKEITIDVLIKKVDDDGYGYGKELKKILLVLNGIIHLEINQLFYMKLYIYFSGKIYI